MHMMGVAPYSCALHVDACLDSRRRHAAGEDTGRILHSLHLGLLRRCRRRRPVGSLWKFEASVVRGLSFMSMPSVAEPHVLEFLDQVRNEGGVVFAGLAEKAYGGEDEKAAEAAYELAWEELHAAPWGHVPLVWRDAFALSCLSLASCHRRANRPAEARKVLDLGVIMGGRQFRTELDSSLESMSASTAAVKPDLETSNGLHHRSHPEEALPNLQDMHLSKNKEGQMLQDVNNVMSNFF